MCGISGVFGRPDAETVKVMLSALVHRGPDDEFSVAGEAFALGSRRLAIVGVADYKCERTYTGPRQFSLEQWADLSARALADAGIESHEVNGLVCVGDIGESAMFHPATIAEYCGWSVDFAERVDLGGASSVAAVWRAAAAIELGMCDVVVVTSTGRPRPDAPAATPQARARSVNASSWIYGSPQAEFEVPYGDVPPNIGFAKLQANLERLIMAVREYAHDHG